MPGNNNIQDYDQLCNEYIRPARTSFGQNVYLKQTLPGFSPAPPFTLLLLCPCPASARKPLHLPYSCPTLTPALLFPCTCSASALVPPTPIEPPSSSSAPYDFSRHGQSRLYGI